MRDLLYSNIIYYNSSGRLPGSDIYNHECIFGPGILSLKNDELGVLELVNFSCMNSIYNIDELRNSKFYISINGGSDILIELTEGNFSFSQMVTMIQNLLNNSQSDTVFTLTANLRSFKILFEYTNSVTVAFKTYGTLTAYELLGFASFPHTLGASPYDSPELCSIGNIPNIYLHCSLANNTTFISSNPGNSSDILHCIPNLSAPFGNLFWEKQSFAPYVEFTQSVSKISLSMTDLTGNFVKLRRDYQCVFVFSVYKKEPIDLNKLESLISISAIDSIQKKHMNVN